MANLSNPVTLEIHHGGSFVWKPNIEYVGGEVKCLLDCDREKLSHFYFQTLYHILVGKNEPCLVYYRLPGISLENGLCSLKTDIDVHAMVDVYDGLNVICMYMVKEAELDGGHVGTETGSERQKDIVVFIDDDVEKQGEEEIEGNCDKTVTSEDEELKDDEDKPLSVLSSAPSWYDEGLEMPNDDIFGAVAEPGGPNFLSDDWFSDSEDPTQAEELRSLSNSEDGEMMRKEIANTDEFNEVTGMKNPTLFVGLKFSTSQVFRKAMVRWNVIRGHDIEYIKNENKVITAKCKYECGWRIHASPIGRTSTFQIKTFSPEHTCGRKHENHLVNSRYLVDEYLDDLRDNNEMRVTTMKRKAKRDLNVEVSKWQFYRARNKVKQIVEGDIKKQFALLRNYCSTVMQHNPGSCFNIQTVHNNVETSGEHRFLRLYVRLAAQKAGYLAACRPIVGLDGCFLKGFAGGQMLSAVCRDGNDNLFPLAIAVVESECKDTWTWFLTQFLFDMGGVQERGWVFISDRQKGLVETINELMPGVEHRFCLRHMYANFKQKYKGKELKDMFWKASSTANLNDWKCAMEDIKKADPPKLVNGEEGECAFNWLMKANPHNWARSHFSTRAKCDILVNNMNESWNNYILDARDMHIISMLEWIRKALMTRFQVKRAGMLKHNGKIGPNIFKKLEKIKTASGNCFPTWSGGMVFEVECYEGVNIKQCSVNLEAKTCTCRMWDVSGIPCKHAVSAIFLNKQQPEDYLHPCFSRDAYLATYNFQIFPVPGEHDYVSTGLPPLLPPIMKKQPGRPKKKRNKTADELPPTTTSKHIDPSKVSRKNLPVTCAKCLKTGHNKIGCKGDMHPNSKLLKPRDVHQSGVKRKEKRHTQSEQHSVHNQVVGSRPQFQNPFTSSNSLLSESARPHSSSQPQPQFQNLFSQQLIVRPTVVHGSNGAMFQIGGRNNQQQRKGQGKLSKPTWRI